MVLVTEIKQGTVTALWVLATVVLSMGQVIFLKASARVFGTQTNFLVLVLSFISLPFYGIFLLTGRLFHQGFLPEVRSRTLQRSFVVIGFCNATSRVIEFFAFNATPLTLQASLSHTIIPFVVAFTISADLSVGRVFSKKALGGTAMIIVGSLFHMSAYFLYSSDATVTQIWWYTTFLLAQIPLALSAIIQQQCYIIRRLNVFYMLFYCTMYQCLWSLLFVPLNCIRGVNNIAPSQLWRALVEFVICGLNLQPLGSFREPAATGITTDANYCSTAALYLGLLAVFTIGAQMAQICMVRQSTYPVAMVGVLSIPTAVFTLFALKPFQAMFGTYFAVLLEGNPGELPQWVQGLCYTIVLVGAGFYRLDPANGLAAEYVFPPDSYFEEHGTLASYYAPLVPSHPPKPMSAPMGLAVNNGAPAYPDPAAVRPSHSSDIAHLVRDRTATVRSFPDDARSMFYFASPLPRHKPLPAVVRPVMMNVWCGMLVCEYTDYKRNYDAGSISEDGVSTPLRASLSANRPDPFGEHPGRCPPWKQYTYAHMDALGDTERAIRKLYAYHRMGSLAAVVALLSELTPLTPSSELSSAARSTPRDSLEHNSFAEPPPPYHVSEATTPGGHRYPAASLTWHIARPVITNPFPQTAPPAANSDEPDRRRRPAGGGGTLSGSGQEYDGRGVGVGGGGGLYPHLSSNGAEEHVQGREWT
ncbi:unnamed protein product [Vitrella brassicaformis CCMP3155]|uniref:Uncharacterized protein n=2 Tax=Vitrella brassicaformis TaxID=1169539 RepID=A0A0G4EP46_VITBC|nr:unnamed protein product [Vitrella brassicaformis CCMP3155]|eukprot:CEL99199.1 unnamed protein product [Vitrella brassicaformis CCMP3155]